MNNMIRCWINQPSTSQFYHKYHGELVLAEQVSRILKKGLSENGPETLVYFTRGDIVGMDVYTNALSLGWPEHLIKERSQS